MKSRSIKKAIWAEFCRLNAAAWHKEAFFAIFYPIHELKTDSDILGNDMKMFRCFGSIMP